MERETTDEKQKVFRMRRTPPYVVITGWTGVRNRTIVGEWQKGKKILELVKDYGLSRIYIQAILRTYIPEEYEASKKKKRKMYWKEEL